MALSLRPPHQHVSAIRTRNRALHHQHVVLGVDFDYLQIAHRDLGIAQMSAHAHAGHNPRRIAGCADRSGCPVEHRSVRAFAAAEVVAFDHARKPLALADADDIHLVRGFELTHQHLVAGFQIVGPGAKLELAHELRAVDAGFLQTAGGGFVDALWLDELEQAELRRVVTVDGRRLALHHHARSGFQQRHRHHPPVRPEQLRHSNLLAKDSWTHVNFLSRTGLPACPFYLFSERFDFDIHTGRQIELHQRVYRLLGRFQNVEQPLVRPDFKLFPRFLVHVRGPQYGRDRARVGKGTATAEICPVPLRGIHNLRRRLIEDTMIVRLQTDSNTFSQSHRFTCLRHAYLMISVTVPAPT